MPIAHDLSQRAADVQPLGLQHRARGGSKPKKQAILLKPREDALLIGCQKPLCRQIPAHCHQAVVFGNGLMRVGELQTAFRQQRNILSHKGHLSEP